MLGGGSAPRNQNQFGPAGDHQRAQLQQVIGADYQEARQGAHHGQVIVRDPGLAPGGVVLHRDANHQACAAGVIKCHTLLALTVNKPSRPTS